MMLSLACKDSRNDIPSLIALCVLSKQYAKQNMVSKEHAIPDNEISI